MISLLQQGGITIYLLLACSVAVVAVAFERLWRLRQASADPILFLSKLSRFLAEGRVGEAAAYCDRSSAAIAAVANAGLTKSGRGKDEIRDTLSSAIALQTHLLGRNLSILGTIAATAPFVGLFGTVLGIMRSFHAISVQKTAGLHVVGAGIAEALITTAGGLAVAILAVFVYNAYQSWISRLGVEMEVVATEVLHLAATAPGAHSVFMDGEAAFFAPPSTRSREGSGEAAGYAMASGVAGVGLAGGLSRTGAGDETPMNGGTEVHR